MKFFSTTLFFLAFVVVFFVFSVGHFVNAETVESIACVDDGSNTGRNILKITGNHSTKFFSVAVPSSNCDIFIHDVVFCGISFSAGIVNNTNITIQNATSTNKFSPIFIYFADVISDFGFININHINHSSLTLAPITPSQWIAGVMFGSAITGKSELTRSNISISNIVMTDIICEGSTNDCWTALLRFESTVTNISSLNLHNFTASDISMRANSTGWAILCCHCFDAPLNSVQRIAISRVEVARVSLETFGSGNAELRLSYFVATVSASPTGETRISVANYSLRNFSASANLGNGFLIFFHTRETISNYVDLSFVDMSMTDVNSTSARGVSNTRMLFIGDSIFGPTHSAGGNLKSSSIVVRNVQMLRINSTSFDYSLIFQLFVENSIANYSSLSCTNIFGTDVTSTSSSGYARVVTVSIGNATTTTSTQMPSSFLVANFRTERANCASSSYTQLYHLEVRRSVSNYSQLALLDMYILEANVTSSNGYGLILIVSSGGSISAPPLLLSSTITVSNLQVARVSSRHGTSSTIYMFYVVDAVAEYNTVSFSNISACNVSSEASNSYSKVRLVYIGNFAVSGVSDSSFTVHALRIEAMKPQANTDSIVSLFYVFGSITNYTAVSIANSSLIEVNSSSSTTNSNVFMFYCGGSVVSSSASSTSSITVTNFKMERVASQSQFYSFVYLFVARGSIENYRQIICRNISAIDVHSTSSSLISFVMMFASSSLLASPSSSSASLVVSNVTLRNIASLGPSSSRIVMFNMDSPSLIRGFDSVTFDDSVMQNVAIQSASQSATIVMFGPGGFQDCNDIRVFNNNLQDVVITSTISGVALVALVSATSSSANCRLVEINNNSISNISVVAPTQNGEVNLMKLPFDQVTNISLRNNNITLTFLPSSTSSITTSNVFVSLVPLSISSSTQKFSLDISNCSLEVRSQYWQKMCSPAKCSLIRVNDVQINNNNKIPSSTSISESRVTSPSSSLISFANFGNGAPNRADAILNFDLEKNYFLNLTAASPIFGFDSSSRLPPLVFVDVKCNHWSHLTDRMTSQQLIFASSAIQAHQFVQWSCPFHSPSRSVSVTQTESFGAKAAAGATLNHVLAVGTNVAQSTGIVAVAAVAAVSPSLGFGVARQQAMVNFMQNIRDGDCSGISDPNEVPAADSPTQMKIGTGDAKFYVGGAVGNTILSISLILAMQIVGTIVLKYSGSSSWNRPFDVFARCNVALVGYVCASLLLAPTLTFGLVTVSVSNIENLSVGSKILAIIFSIIFAVPTFYYAIWSVLLRPNMELEQYRKLPKKNKEVSFIVRVLNFFFEGEGEWMLHKKANLKEKLNFDAATPMFEGYNGRAKWFGIVEFVVQVGLAFAPFLANLVPVEKSCVTTFAVLMVVFGGYLILCIWLRPFQELFNRIVIPIVTLFQIGVVILTYVYADNPPDFIVSLAMLTVSLQNAMIVIVLVASFSPLMKHALRAYRKWKRWWSKRIQQKLKSNKNNNVHRVPSLRYLIDEGENDEELNLRDKNRVKSSKNDGESARNKRFDQGNHNRQHHQSRDRSNSDTKAASNRSNDSLQRSNISNNNHRNHENKRAHHNESASRSSSQRREYRNNENNNRGRESSRSWHDGDDRHDRGKISDREQSRYSRSAERR